MRLFSVLLVKREFVKRSCARVLTRERELELAGVETVTN